MKVKANERNSHAIQVQEASCTDEPVVARRRTVGAARMNAKEFFADYPWLNPERFESEAFDRALDVISGLQEQEEKIQKRGFVSGSLVA